VKYEDVSKELWQVVRLRSVYCQIEQDADPAIAVARVVLNQPLNLAQQQHIVGRVRDLPEA
jgi:hypothetical protein